MRRHKEKEMKKDFMSKMTFEEVIAELDRIGHASTIDLEAMRGALRSELERQREARQKIEALAQEAKWAKKVCLTSIRPSGEKLASLWEGKQEAYSNALQYFPVRPKQHHGSLADPHFWRAK